MKLSDKHSKLTVKNWADLAKEILEKEKEKTNFSSRNTLLGLILKLEGQKRDSIFAKRLRELTMRPGKRKGSENSLSGLKRDRLS